MELSQTFTSVEALTSLSPSSYYNIAYAEVKEALKKSGKLEQDSLMGNAYTLQALCEWKLKRYNQAVISSRKAIGYFDTYEKAGLFMPRDKAVMKALTGLVEIDRVNDTIFSHFSKAQISLADAKDFYLKFVHHPDEAVKANLESAVNTIEKAKEEAKTGHEVQVYFLLCQLSAHKVWSDSYNFLKNALKSDEETPAAVKLPILDFLDEEEKIYLAKKSEYLELLAKKLPRGKEDSVYGYWEKIL